MPANVGQDGVTTSRLSSRRLLEVDVLCQKEILQRTGAANAVHRSNTVAVHTLEAVAACTPAFRRQAPPAPAC